MRARGNPKSTRGPRGALRGGRSVASPAAPRRGSGISPCHRRARFLSAQIRGLVEPDVDSSARGHGSASGKNFLRPSMTAFPASHSGASGARGQIIVGAALPLRRRAVGNAPRCGTRAWAVAIQSRVSCMACGRC